MTSYVEHLTSGLEGAAHPALDAVVSKVLPIAALAPVPPLFCVRVLHTVMLCMHTLMGAIFV